MKDIFVPEYVPSIAGYPAVLSILPLLLSRHHPVGQKFAHTNLRRTLSESGRGNSLEVAGSCHKKEG